jgi:hypothetical protein
MRVLHYLNFLANLCILDFNLLPYIAHMAFCRSSVISRVPASRENGHQSFATQFVSRYRGKLNLVINHKTVWKPMLIATGKQSSTDSNDVIVLLSSSNP